MEIEDAPKHAQLAYAELEALGAPVKRSHYVNGAYFSIDAEQPEAQHFVDYWSNYWGSKKLNKILDKHGLFFEWENPAWCNVYDI